VDQHVIADPALVLGWSRHLVEGGLPGLLDATREVLYPPLAMLGIWLSGLLTTWIGGPEALAAPTAVVAIKAWAILGDAGLALLVARLLRPVGPVASVAGAAAITFNPAFWYLATLWGQIDSVVVLLLVASVSAMAAGRVASGWIAWAGAVLWKLQALPLAPVVVVQALRTRGPRGVIAGAAGAGLLAIACAALLLAGGGAGPYAERLWPRATFLDISAFNAWYLVTRDVIGLGAIGEALEGANGAAIGYGLAGLTILLAVAALWRRPSAVNVALCAGMASLAAFLFLPGMRERYLLPVIPMLALVAGGWPAGRPDRGAAAAFLVITATQALNLVAVGSPAPDLWLNVFAPASTGPLIPAVTVLGAAAAVANLAVLGWGMRRLTGPGRT
jgi:hypothetical protein